VLTFFGFLTSSIPANAQMKLVIAAIDDTDRVVIKHTTHRLAQPGFELSPAEPDMRMERLFFTGGRIEKSIKFRRWIPNDSMRTEHIGLGAVCRANSSAVKNEHL
jgi:hypothetical protein